MAIEDNSTYSSLSPQNQRGTAQPQNDQIEDTIRYLEEHGYQVTEEYSNTGKLLTVSGEHPRRKTWWDWMQLLIVPLLLLLLGSGFALAQYVINQKIATDNRHQDFVIAQDNQEEATLKAYLDDMTTLLLKKPGSQAVADKAASDDETYVIARANTLTTLRRLTNPQRKAAIVQFLYESNLIGYYDLTNHSQHGRVIDLRGADLHGADLSSANLSNATLSGVDLSYANLSGANLSGANLSGAILNSANLSRANLSNATLSRAILNSAHLDGATLNSAHLNSATLNSANLNSATLNSANLSNATLYNAPLHNAILHNAILSDTDLREAKGLTQQQLDQVYTCKGAILPQELTCHHNP